MKKSDIKSFKTIDQQITILRGKGLIIDDNDETRNLLLRENYFFISGYRHLFMKNGNKDNFLDGTTFEELYAMFVFDRKLRNIFFKNILIVENNIKSIISYQLSKKYGYKEKDYLNQKNFIQDKLKGRKVKDVLNKMYRQIRVNTPKHTATMHYADNYGYIPLWILVKVLSFGIVSEFYGILKLEDKKCIADLYGIGPDVLERYLVLLSNFRNVCAHEDILYNHKTQRLIPDTVYHEKLNIVKIDDVYKYGKNDLFCLIIMLKTMLNHEEFDEMLDEIKEEVNILDNCINVVPLIEILKIIGFPVNWYDIKYL